MSDRTSIARLLPLAVVATLVACEGRGSSPLKPPSAAPVLLFGGTGTSAEDVAAVEAILGETHLGYALVRARWVRRGRRQSSRLRRVGIPRDARAVQNPARSLPVSRWGTARGALVRSSKNGVGRLSPRTHQSSIFEARRAKTPSDGGGGTSGGSGPTEERSKMRQSGGPSTSSREGLSPPWSMNE